MAHRMFPRAAAPRAVAVLAICLTPVLAAEAGTFEGRVGDGLSDAEETSSGSMSLTSSDLELVTDGTTQAVNGAYSLTTVASDGAGNRAVSTPVVVTVDNTVPPPPPPPPGGTRIVPDQFATIQAAIDAAGDGDTVLVRPGTYTGGLLISGKRITLESEYPRTGDPARIENTIVADGSPILDIAASAVGVVVEGFTFKNGRLCCGRERRPSHRPQQPLPR
jgi:hypothetical protein